MDAPALKATREQMAEQYMPIHVRDYCAHILIPLNKCRRANMFSPFSCEDERHSYEICMYNEYERRRTLKNAQKST